MTDHAGWIDRDVEKAHATAQIMFQWHGLEDCKQCVPFDGTCNRPTGRTCWQARVII